MPSGVAIAASIIHPSFTVLTIVGNSPEGPDKECEYLLHNSVNMPAANLPATARQQTHRFQAVFLSLKLASSTRYTILNDSAKYLMLLFCKQINTVQKSCYAARRGIGHLPYKLLSHRSVKRTPAAYDNESEENRRARRIP